jgi:hypothetical protein
MAQNRPVAELLAVQLADSARSFAELIQCDTSAAEGFQLVVEKTMFATALKSNYGEAMLADLVNRNFLSCAFDTHTISNSDMIFIDHLYAPI